MTAPLQTTENTSPLCTQTLGVRAAIVVASVHHGNTNKIARAMAEVLHADLFSVEDMQAEQLRGYDLIGFGSGIYFGRHHTSLKSLISAAPELPVHAFVFSTAGLPFLHWLFHWPLCRTLTKRGCRIVGEFSCRGWDTVGPLWLMGGINRRHPNNGDEERARGFAKQTMQLSITHSSRVLSGNDA